MSNPVTHMSRFLRRVYPGDSKGTLNRSDVITWLFMATVALSLLTSLYLLLFCFSEGQIGNDPGGGA